MKVHVITCTHCGKAVTPAFSWPEENGPFVLRAFVECPECVEAQPDLPQAELELAHDRLAKAERLLAGHPPCGACETWTEHVFGCNGVPAELELARRVADAAMAIEIAHNAIVRVNQLDPNRIVTPISDQDAIWKLIDAERAALGALMNAVREYRARVEAAAIMEQPAVRRGLEGVGEMEEGESLIKETSEE